MRHAFGLVLLLAAACTEPAAAPAAPAAETLGLLNQGAPRPGLVTSGQPTEAQFDALGKAGITMVIHLRPATEEGTGWEEAKAQALGLQFVRLPIAGADDMTPANAEKLAASLATANGPVLLCCASSNRCGGLLAMKAFFLDGKSKDEALALGRAGGLKALEPAVAAKLAK